MKLFWKVPTWWFGDLHLDLAEAVGSKSSEPPKPPGGFELRSLEGPQFFIKEEGVLAAQLSQLGLTSIQSFFPLARHTHHHVVEFGESSRCLTSSPWMLRNIPSWLVVSGPSTNLSHLGRCLSQKGKQKPLGAQFCLVFFCQTIFGEPTRYFDLTYCQMTWHRHQPAEPYFSRFERNTPPFSLLRKAARRCTSVANCMEGGALQEGNGELVSARKSGKIGNMFFWKSTGCTSKSSKSLSPQ